MDVNGCIKIFIKLFNLQRCERGFFLCVCVSQFIYHNEQREGYPGQYMALY